MLASFSNSGRPIKWRRLVLLTPIFAAAAWAFIYFGGDWSTPQLALLAAFVGAAGFVGETLVLAWKRRPRFLRLDPLESVAYGAWMAPGTQALGSVWSNDPPDSTQIATLGLAVAYWAVFHELFFQIPGIRHLRLSEVLDSTQQARYQPSPPLTDDHRFPRR